jgi:hypothetical protein
MHDLLRGRVSYFSLDALVNIASAIGHKVHVFVRDLPRLPGDSDRVRLPFDARKTALKNVRAALSRIVNNIRQALCGSEVMAAHEETDELRLHVNQNDLRIKNSTRL